ncbi:hypothetical protein EV642_111217 [Kribbella sp. VKM Ac-2500]|nr:hypothetical protein EV642_111217 [Kribbella sp. VKM Ac-2500]
MPGGTTRTHAPANPALMSGNDPLGAGAYQLIAGLDTPGGRQASDGSSGRFGIVCRLSRPAFTTLTYVSRDDLAEVAELLAGMLGVAFQARSSDSPGGDFLLAGDWREAYAEEVYVQPNDDLGTAAEPEYAALPTLVSIECTRRAD